MECPVCHKEFKPIRTGQKRCSAHCNVVYQNQIRKVPATERVCGVCGKHFFSNRFQKFCSKKCCVKYHHNKAYVPHPKIRKVVEVIEKFCVICGDKLPKHKRIYCSTVCEKKGEKLQTKTRETRYCLNCGEPLPPRRLKYCSDECAYSYQSKYLRDPEKVKAIRLKSRNKYKNDLVTKVRRKASDRIRKILRGDRKAINYHKGVISYTEHELRSHLEKGFKQGMDWNNYGVVWHIDHKIPVTAFNLSCDEDIKRCWSLKNLQPMFALDNIKKSNRIERPFQPLLI